MNTNPKEYLSFSGGKFRVIVQGLPICADKATEAEALAAAAAYKIDLKWKPVWNGDRGEWVLMGSFSH